MVLSGKGSYRREQLEKSVRILVFSRAATYSFVVKKYSDLVDKLAFSNSIALTMLCSPYYALDIFIYCTLPFSNYTLGRKPCRS